MEQKLGLSKDEDSPVDDRVFVCIGKYRKSNKAAYWVMTLNKKFNSVTMWDCVKHE
jgi:hypothetical protein